MRILHLVEPPAPGRAGTLRRPGAHDAGVLACRAAIERTPQLEHRVCVIGPGPGETRARALGLSNVDRIAPALAVPALAWFGLESLVRDQGAPGAVQCWSRSLLRLARLSLGNSVPIVGPPEVFPTPEPGLRGDGQDLRRAMGVRPGEPTLLLLADPPSQADARRFVFMLGLLEVAGCRCAGLIPAGARFTWRARRFWRDAHLGCTVIFTNLPAWALIPASDVAVLHSTRDEAFRDEPAQSAAIWRAAAGAAMRHGLPVVAPAVADLNDLYDPAIAERLVARTSRASDMAARVIRLLNDPGYRSEVSAALHAAPGLPEQTRRAVSALAASWLHPQSARTGTAGPVAVGRQGVGA